MVSDDLCEVVSYSCLIDLECTPCLEKNIPDFFSYNLKKDYQILIIFDVNISDTNGDQMTVRFFAAPIVCFCTTWGN